MIWLIYTIQPLRQTGAHLLINHFTGSTLTLILFSEEISLNPFYTYGDAIHGMVQWYDWICKQILQERLVFNVYLLRLDFEKLSFQQRAE